MKRLKEYCGLFGVFGDTEAAQLVALGLFALQHRGEESAGVVVSQNGQLQPLHGMGLVSEVLKPESLAPFRGAAWAIGHTRYSTAGGSGLHNCQPFVASSQRGSLAVAHNGTLLDIERLRAELVQSGAMFRSTSDSEVILQLVAMARDSELSVAIAHALTRVKGAYSLLFLTPTSLIGVRDPFGFRPLVLGRRQDAWMLASETCALDMVEAEYVREIEPGEMVTIDAQGLHSQRLTPASHPQAPCVFEHVYFSRPDSVVFGRSVYESRKKLGRELARAHPVAADVVIAVPDSGVPAALGFSEASRIPFEMALTRSHYVGRSFIQPAQAIRAQTVRLKLATHAAALKGKRVVVVDDSLVRGTTAQQIVHLLRKAGAREVHMRISAPPTISPCYYGIDMPSQSDLMAAQMSTEKIRQQIEADSLGYLDLTALRLAIGYQENSFCEACFSEKYPLR